MTQFPANVNLISTFFSLYISLIRIPNILLQSISGSVETISGLSDNYDNSRNCMVWPSPLRLSAPIRLIIGTDCLRPVPCNHKWLELKRRRFELTMKGAIILPL